VHRDIETDSIGDALARFLKLGAVVIAYRVRLGDPAAPARAQVPRRQALSRRFQKRREYLEIAENRRNPDHLPNRKDFPS
jgi:hypothetical protein